MLIFSFPVTGERVYRWIVLAIPINSSVWLEDHHLFHVFDFSLLCAPPSAEYEDTNTHFNCCLTNKVSLHYAYRLSTMGWEYATCFVRAVDALVTRNVGDGRLIVWYISTGESHS
jgi:hypothetical protein